MTKYLLRRLLHGLISVVIVIAIVMLLIYSLTDREKIFGNDSLFSKKVSNQRISYKYTKWEKYGYLDYVTYNEYLVSLVNTGEIDEQTRTQAASYTKEVESLNDPQNRLKAQVVSDLDPEIAHKYIEKFYNEYTEKGYTVERYNVEYYSKITKKIANGGNPIIFAYKDVNLFSRLGSFFKNLFTVDTIRYVDKETDIGQRKLTFTLYDPAYTDADGTKHFSPAVIGNGTKHKYLLYFDDEFPFIHQNVFNISLGTSYSVNLGVDVYDTMIMSQGKYVKRMVTYPTGFTNESADDIHTATYVAGSRQLSSLLQDRYNDDYTNVSLHLASKSKIGYSFVIGIISSLIAYLLGVPLGILMARKKDKLTDKIGTLYIIFIIAVPSLAYIFMFQAIGRAIGLEPTFDVNNETWLMYILPIVSLALPSIAGLMKWLRRYMIDQMNSDYVRFARSNGLSEREIFSKHIFKNAVIPIIHGIPGTIRDALIGAIITERVYHVPGAGNLLTNAINATDNSVIVGLTLFYALLSIISLILGDILMSITDPRISFTTKAR